MRDIAAHIAGTRIDGTETYFVVAHVHWLSATIVLGTLGLAAIIFYRLGKRRSTAQ